MFNQLARKLIPTEFYPTWTKFFKRTYLPAQKVKLYEKKLNEKKYSRKTQKLGKSKIIKY